MLRPLILTQAKLNPKTSRSVTDCLTYGATGDALGAVVASHAPGLPHSGGRRRAAGVSDAAAAVPAAGDGQQCADAYFRRLHHFSRWIFRAGSNVHRLATALGLAPNYFIGRRGVVPSVFSAPVRGGCL